MTSSPIEDLYRRPGFLLKRCNQVSAAIFLDECREFSMTPSQYGCLLALNACPGIDQLTLGRLVGLDRSTVGLVVKLLTTRGLIQRVIDSRDKRRLSLKITSDGQQLLRAIEPAAGRVQERVLSVLPRDSRATFLQMLQTFLAGHHATIDVAEVLAGSTAEAQAEPRKAAARPRPTRAVRSSRSGTAAQRSRRA